MRVKKIFYLIWIAFFSLVCVFAEESTYDIEAEGEMLSTDWLIVLGGVTAILPCSILCLSFVLNCCTDLELMKMHQLTGDAQAHSP